jgi:tetraacyldisaccharide 4'-kinase
MRKFLYNLATDKYSNFFAKFLQFFLFILSLVYGLIIMILRFIYQIKPKHPGCKVISVGNITLGGTGKTVLVEYLTKYLLQQGRKVAILTRGYGKKGIRKEHMADEPQMLQKNLKDVPVIIDADRIRGAVKAVADFKVDTVILDDGFQQWRIKKDIDIVMVDATDPFGNQQMVPRGILREPLSALKRADIFMLAKTNLNPNVEDIEEFLETLNPQALIAESAHYPVGLYLLGEPEKTFGLDMLRAKTVALFSGIADPDSFEDLIESLGANIGLSFKFPDHHNYSEEELEDIIQESRGKNIHTIITTEKDAARLYELRVTSYELRILILRIELKITKNEQGFHGRLLKLYSL